MGEQFPKMLRISIEICEPETWPSTHRNGRPIPAVPRFLPLQIFNELSILGSKGGGQASFGNIGTTAA